MGRAWRQLPAQMGESGMHMRVGCVGRCALGGGERGGPPSNSRRGGGVHATAARQRTGEKRPTRQQLNTWHRLRLHRQGRTAREASARRMERCDEPVREGRAGGRIGCNARCPMCDVGYGRCVSHKESRCLSREGADPERCRDADARCDGEPRQHACGLAHRWAVKPPAASLEPSLGRARWAGPHAFGQCLTLFVKVWLEDKEKCPSGTFPSKPATWSKVPWA